MKKGHIAELALTFLVGIAVIAIVGGVLDFAGYNPGAAAMNAGHILVAGFAPIWPLVAAMIVVGACMAAFPAAENSPVAIIGIVVVLVVATGVSVRTANRYGHDVAHAQINRVLTVSEDSPPEYEVRDPYAVATTRLSRSVGDEAGFDVTNVWRFDVDGTPKTCGIKVPNANEWRRPLGGVVCVTDDGVVENEAFEGQVPSWTAAFGENRLAGRVNDLFPRGRFVISDIYGYVDGDGPHIVVPVTRIMGGMRWHEGWVGAAVWDTDGTARKVTDPAEVPGPVAGESLSDQVLDALNHRNGFMDSKRRQTGYDLGEGDNVRHHLLDRADGSGERLVTLLTPRGSSNTVTAVLEVNPRDIVNGWPTATLYQLEDRNENGSSRASVAEATDLVRQRYGTAMQMSESGLRVMEASPSTHNDLVVAVGSDQRVFARVTVDMMSRETCVFTPDGEQVRCDSQDAQPLALGSLRRLFTEDTDTSTDDSPEPNPGGQPASNMDISSMSDDELTDLLRQVADELDARNG